MVLTVSDAPLTYTRLRLFAELETNKADEV